MILDTSAVVAIAFKEPGFMSLVDKLAKASNIAIGVPTLTETAIVLSARLSQDARGLLSRELSHKSTKSYYIKALLPRLTNRGCNNRL